MTYKLVNRVLLAVGVCVLCLIAILHLTGRGQCGSVALWGKPCGLCGCTRDFFDIVKGNFDCRNPLSIPLFVLLVAECCWRMVASFFRVGKGLILVEVAAHGLLLTIFVVYNLAVIIST